MWGHVALLGEWTRGQPTQQTAWTREGVPLSHSVPDEPETRGQEGDKALCLLLKVIEGPGLLLL